MRTSSLRCLVFAVVLATGAVARPGNGPSSAQHYKPRMQVDVTSQVETISVLAYGALGDNSTDNTAAFVKALAAAQAMGGATVYIPGGWYRFNGSFTVPGGVVLRGNYGVVPSHDLVQGGSLPHDGTILVPLGGRGDAEGTPFVTLPANAMMSGVVFYYQEQETVKTPVPYPWTIQMSGNNAAVMDVELLGSYNGINATKAHRHYIARVQGQPLNIGVFVDSTYDIGRIEDVHFNPWFSVGHPFIEWQLTHGRAFVLGRSDWEYVFNTFAFGYAIGYHFINTPTGQMNGNFLGIGADLSINASVQVDASQAAGILITNGEFTAFHTPGWLPKSTVESSQVVVGKENKGPVKFVDSSFWGPSSQIALLEGQGTVTFASCEFVEWDEQKRDGRAAIQASNGSLILNGNSFAQNKKQVSLGKGVKKAIITANIVTGAKNMDIDAAVKAQVGLNAFDV